MKFIKTIDGNAAINAAQIVVLYIGGYADCNDKAHHTIKAITTEDDTHLLAEFDSKDEAQEYLDKLVEQLNGGLDYEVH